MDSTSKPEADESLKNQEILGLLRSLHLIDQRERDHAVSVLQSLDRESTVESLLRLLTNADGDVRCDAAEALMRIDSRQGTEAVLPLLADPDPDVRWHTCGLLYDRGNERATTRLVEVLLNDPEGYVRLFAAHALGNVGDLSAVPGLRHAAQFDTGQDHEGRRVSQAAKEAIESIEKRHGKSV
jgi:HEAT repeat protein